MALPARYNNGEMKMSDKEQEQFKKAAIATGEKIEQSTIFLSLLSKDYKTDPVVALQLGIAILLNKPIAVISLNGEEIPEALKKLAFCVEQIDDRGKEGLQAATARIIQVAHEKKILQD
jgi:hypothetical protein